MLRVILAGAELELAPPEVAGHPAIRRQAEALGKKPGQILLDQNAHSTAMGKLEDARRRGRPDLIHVTLLVLLELPAAKAGALEVIIHTRDERVIRVRPDTRLPRGEARFHGLMAKVLQEGKSQEKDPLIWNEGVMDAAEVVRKLAKGPVIRLDEKGEAMTPAALVERASEGGAEGSMTIVLGAFPSGDFPKEWLQATPVAASIWRDPLNVWAVAAEVAVAHRARWGPTQPVPPSA